MTDKQRAKIFLKNHLWMAGNGHFDLSLDDIAEVFHFVRLCQTSKQLDQAFQGLYETHPDKIAIDLAFQESYLQY